MRSMCTFHIHTHSTKDFLINSIRLEYKKKMTTEDGEQKSIARHFFLRMLHVWERKILILLCKHAQRTFEISVSREMWFQNSSYRESSRKSWETFFVTEKKIEIRLNLPNETEFCQQFDFSQFYPQKNPHTHILDISKSNEKRENIQWIFSTKPQNSKQKAYTRQRRENKKMVVLKSCNPISEMTAAVDEKDTKRARTWTWEMKKKMRVALRLVIKCGDNLIGRSAKSESN